MEYRKNKYRAYTITDTSMDTPEEPLKGATIMVDLERQVKDGDMVLVEVNGGLVCRWYRIMDDEDFLLAGGGQAIRR